jgi:hypothetical protein
MKVGYVRVSTIDQNEGRQLVKMKEVKVEKLYIEKVSGKDIEGRPELKNMLEFVREGDTVYVHDFSRLARSTKDLLYIGVAPFFPKKVTKYEFSPIKIVVSNIRLYHYFYDLIEPAYFLYYLI